MLDSGFHNMDCRDAMKEYPDGFFDLAVVDPPYGIKVFAKDNAGRSKLATSKKYKQYAGGDNAARILNISHSSKEYHGIRLFSGRIISWTISSKGSAGKYRRRVG